MDLVKKPGVKKVKTDVTGWNLIATKKYTKGQPVVVYSGIWIAEKDADHGADSNSDSKGEAPALLKVELTATLIVKEKHQLF